MRVLIKTKLSMIVLCLTSTGFAANNVVENENPKGMRCITKDLSSEECLVEQKAALKEGCINESEYNSLIKNNYFPICISIQQKSHLLGLCHCN